ncbi:cilia- and flagella- associated protein 210 [Ambystoma mexicanum]|uniref:cilia- and flagella- associated protein 210 n=1 Tax=Ambystoma mexicanum TaxID=8296 RepID=UPI0037E8AE94
MGTLAAPEVQYGRRKGASRACPVDVPLEDDESSTLLANGVDVRQMTLLPKAEWERIRNNLNTLDKEAIRVCAEKREKDALHQRSKEIVKNWTNTIAGQRQMRLKSKLQREEKEEAEKKRLDLEEDELQAVKRRQAIQEAKTKLYCQIDKVKRFHGALMLTEAIREREAQIELKNKIACARKKQDDDQMKRKFEAETLQEQQKAYHRLMERKQHANDILQQIEENNHKLELLKQKDKKEGAEIQRLTRLYELEMRKLQEMHEKQKEENMKVYRSYLQDRDFLREMEKQKQEAEDERIRLFILAKKKMSKIKNDKEIEVEREVQKQRDHITELLSAQLKEKLDNEDARIANAIAFLEEKAQQEFKGKEDKIKAALKSINEHRIAMIKRKEEKEKEEQLKGLQERYAIQEAAQVFMVHNKEKVLRAEQESKKTQKVQIQQMAERRCKSMNEKKASLLLEKQSEDILSLEEKNFQEYAQHVIDSVIKAGGNPYALQRASQAGFGGGRGPVCAERGGIRPSYMVKDGSGVELPSFQKGSTQQIKELHDPCDINRSRKKLGFTW